MFIHLSHLKLCMHLVRNIPSKTPKRKALVKDEFIRLRDPSPSLNISVDTGKVFVIDNFDCEKDEHLKCIIKFIEDECRDDCYTSACGCDTTKALKVFLPERMECCEKKLELTREGTNGKIFTTTGTNPCKTFTATCKVCSTVYYPGYSETDVNEETRRLYTTLNVETEFFALTKMSVFSLEFLRSVTDQIFVSSSRFDHIATVYNRRKVKEDSLDPTILIDAWIVYHIAKRLPGLSLLVSRKDNRNVDTEAMAQEAFPSMESLINSIWKSHKCREPGCFNRAVVIDGNEKNHRFKCAYNSKCVTRVEGAPNFFSGCINNPIRSEKVGDDGQHVKTRFCKDHVGNQQATENVTSEQADLRPMTRAFVKKLRDQNEDLIDLAEGGITHPSGCRGEEKFTHFFDRTAGMIWMVRPCLVRLGRWEMYSSESCSQWAICLVDQFGEDPVPDGFIKCIIGDIVCAVCPYLKNLGQKGNVVYERYSKLDFILDTWHGDKHVRKECKNDPETGIYHPKLAKWAHMKNTNYEAAEQTFRFINQTKGTTNYMTYSKRLIFFCILDDEYNAHLEEEMMKKNKKGKYKIATKTYDECPIIDKASDQPWRCI